MDQKSNDWPSVNQNCGSKKRAIAETASKLADKTRKHEKDGRDEAKTL